MKPVLSPKFRSWLYPVITAVLALIAAYGVISDEMVPLWLTLVSALLGVAGTGTATVYRPNRVPHPFEYDEGEDFTIHR